MAWTYSAEINPQGSIFGRLARAVVELVLDFWQLANVVSMPIRKTSASRGVFDAGNVAIIEVSSFLFRLQGARPPDRSAEKSTRLKTSNSGRTRGAGKPGRRAARASCRTWRKPSRRKIFAPGRSRSRQK